MVGSIVAWTLVLLVPILATWLAASIAAYEGRTALVSIVIGLVVFPIAPLVWELASTLRSGEKRWLRRRDRLVLRTLATSALFFAALLVLFPKTAFTALATRGDFLLDGRSGPAVERARDAAHDAAKGLEWLYLLARDQPFEKSDVAPNEAEIAPRPSSTVAPLPTSEPAPTASASASATSAPSPAPTTAPEPAPSDHPMEWPASDALSPIVAKMPPEAEKTPAAIGAYIAEREPKQAGRARAVHDWVADRIAYDGPSYRAGLYPPQDADTVLAKRVGVCAGYAKLFAAIAKAAGLEARYVVGTVRGADMRPDGESHAWNAVKVDGAWYLVDTTWDAGYLEGAAFVKRFKSVYFATPPEVFSVDHFPDEPSWQLVRPAIDRGEFFRRPMTSAELYVDGFELVRPDRSAVTTDGPFTIELSSKKGLYVLVKDGKSDCKVVREPGRVDATCPVTGAGLHRVEMFASKVEYGTYHYIGHVDVTRR